MTESNTKTAWLEAETARRYKAFTQQTTMYQDLSEVMVKLADIKQGMRVLDLGCGTGVTSLAALTRLQGDGHLFALDVSGAMLDVARETLPANQTTFIQADATAFANHIDKPIDRVLCNSVFWQIQDKPKVMAELHQILKPDGLFIFNAPEPYFIFQAIPRSNKVAILFKQLAAERYGVGPQDLRTIDVFLNQHHFNLLKTEPFERVRTAEESYLFMQLPVSTAWMEPPLNYETRLALLEEAKQLASSQPKSKRRWMYFVTQPFH